jgi:hypothetical protein
MNDAFLMCVLNCWQAVMNSLSPPEGASVPQLRHGSSDDGACSIGELCEPNNFGARVECPGATSRSGQRPEDLDLLNSLACYVVTFSYQAPQSSAGVGYP